VDTAVDRTPSANAGGLVIATAFSLIVTPAMSMLGTRRSGRKLAPDSSSDMVCGGDEQLMMASSQEQHALLKAVVRKGRDAGPLWSRLPLEF
jgi:hypothetical protein